MTKKVGYNKFRSLYYQKQKKQVETLRTKSSGASDKQLFAFFRDDTSWEEKNHIKKQYSKNRFRDFNFGAFGNVFPKTAKEIIKFPPPKLKSNSLEKTIESYLFTFSQHHDELAFFLEKRNVFETAFINNDYNKAYDSLCSIKQRVGFSIWLADSLKKLSTIANSSEWKQVLNTFNENNWFIRNQITAFIESRGDDKINLLTFLSEFRERYSNQCLKKHPSTSTLSLFSFMRIIFLLPTEPLYTDDFSIGLWISETLSIVDRYFLFKKFLLHCDLNKKTFQLNLPKQAIAHIKNDQVLGLFYFFYPAHKTLYYDFSHNHKDVCNALSPKNDDTTLFNHIFRDFTKTIFSAPDTYESYKYFSHFYSDFECFQVFKYINSFLIYNDQLAQIPIEIQESKGFQTLLQTLKEIAPHSFALIAASPNCKTTLPETIKIFDELRTKCNLNVICLLTTKIIINSWRQAGQYIPIILFIDYITNKTPTLFQYFPIEDILNEIEIINDDDIKKNIELTILTYIHEKSGTKGIDYERIYRHLDDYLESKNLFKPSELINTDLINLNKKTILFGDICVPNVIDSLNDLDSPEEVVIERFTLLNHLVSDLKIKNKHYSDEIDCLIKKLILAESLDELSGGKISINTAQLKNTLIPKTKKYADLYESVDPNKSFTSIICDFISEFLLEEINEQDDYSKVQIVPLRSTIYENIYRIIRTSYLNNPHFGLDNCLSVRIRHTVLKSFIKSIFSNHHLISILGDEDLQIDRNYWETFCKENNCTHRLQPILNNLDNFRKEIEKYVNEIKNNFLHIKNDEHPQGLFNFDIDYKSIKDIDKKITSNYDKPTAEIIIDETFSNLNERLDNSLTSVQNFFLEKASPNLKHQLDILEKNIKSFDIDNVIVSNIRQCKGVIDSHMQEISTWFQREEEDHYRDFHIESLLEDNKLIYERLFPTLQLNIHFKGNNTTRPQIPGKFKSKFVDIFNIIFTNTIVHSGQPLDNCVINSHIEYKDNAVVLEFTNPCHKDKLDKIKEAIQKVKAESQNQTTMLRKLKTEGGSGLLKAKDILANSFSKESTLDYFLKRNHFVLKLNLEKERLFV